MLNYFGFGGNNTSLIVAHPMKARRSACGDYCAARRPLDLKALVKETYPAKPLHRIVCFLSMP